MIYPKTIAELLPIESEPRAEAWGPIITLFNLAMIWAKTGIGKTFFALKLAHSMASGIPFLKWRPSRKFKVLYIDGEMGRVAIRDRIIEMDASEGSLECKDFSVVSFDDFTDTLRLPNLSCPDGQRWYSEAVKPFDIIFIDNLLTASYMKDSRDSDFSQWSRIEPWIIKTRAAGKAVILIHHAGKSGDQLGTSTKEAQQDTIIALKEIPSDGIYTEFAVHFMKHRNFHGKDCEPLHVKFKRDGGAIFWNFSSEKERVEREIVNLYGKGCSKPEIARLLGVEYGRVQMVLNEAEKPSPVHRDDPYF